MGSRPPFLLTMESKMTTLISTYFAENSSARAEVKKDSDSYQIEYYDQGGTLFHTEDFSGKSLRYVEDAAENWAMGIKVLNG